MALLPSLDISGREDAYLMIAKGLDGSHYVEGAKVWVATVVDEATFVAEMGRVDTKREEIIVRHLLDAHVVLIVFINVVHVEEVTHAELVIISASFVSVLRCQDLPNIFDDEGAGWDRFQGEKAPHGGLPSSPADVCRFLDSLNEDLPPVTVLRLH